MNNMIKCFFMSIYSLLTIRNGFTEAVNLRGIFHSYPNIGHG